MNVAIVYREGLATTVVRKGAASRTRPTAIGSQGVQVKTYCERGGEQWLLLATDGGSKRGRHGCVTSVGTVAAAENKQRRKKNNNK
ncbi:hypothetical protein J1N35_025859 [Gossypium stocksii]|uniref:Uncharacterized protein n=1 Tax=Gossypium stocksii TaxID=47602 RepID=A0A9D3ZY36_9ROSI|nr:hypothetical protein J1N35_025859 [Gossypium stocksii]